MPKHSEIDWELAECRGLYTDLFYMVEEERNSTAYQYINAVRSICAKCPLWKECLAYAFTFEDYGVWGGLTSIERKTFIKEQYNPQRSRALENLELQGITESMIREAYEYSLNERGVENQITHYRENGSVGHRRPRER